MTSCLKFNRALLLCSLALLLMGCGNEETATTAAGSGGSGTTSISGSVTIPNSTTTSISQGASASKSVGGGESPFSVSKGASDNSSADSSTSDSSVSGSSIEPAETIVVAKAVADISAGDGTCQIKTASGTLLDTCIINDGKLSGCDIDTSKLDASKQITIIATVNGKTVSSVADCGSCGAGGLLDSGTTNSSSTTAAGLLYYSCDASSTVDSPTSACASKIAAGTFSPKQTYQTTIEELGLSDATVGTDTAKNALLSFKKAIQSYMANNSSFNPGDLLNAIGGGSILSAAMALDSSLSSLNVASLATMTKNHASAVGAYFGDATTAAKWTDATGFAAMAKNFGAYGPADLAAVAAKPENARGLLDKYADDFRNGVSNAFGKLESGGKSFGNYLTKFGTTAMSSGQFLAAKDLFDNCTFGAGVDQSKLGEALYSQIFSADTEAEITKLRAQKGSIGGLLVSNPGAYTGAAGLVAAQGFINFLGTGGSLTGATPCAADSDCSGGKLCGSSGLCFASVAGLGTGTGDIGAVCSAAGDCKSNVCTTSRCDIGGVDFGLLAGFKYFGETCTSTAECINGLTCNTTCGGIFSAAGTLDTTFNSSGFFSHNSAAGGNANDFGLGVAIDSSGKVVTTGYSRNGAGNDDMAIWRLNANGSLDTTFSGDGVFAHNGAAGNATGGDAGWNVVIDSSEKIVVSGYSQSSTSYDMAVWRLNTDGSLDTTFSGDGIFTHNGAAGGNGIDAATGVAIDSAGKILVVGYSQNSSNRDMAVWRLNTNGSLDTTFNSNGFFAHSGAAGGNGTEAGNGIVVDSSGKILVAGVGINGSGNNDMVVWRLNTNGSLDTTFNGSGIFTHNSAAGGNLGDTGTGVTIDSAGRVVVTGYSRNGAGNDDIAVWRLNTNGSLDTTFNGSGIFTHNSAAGGNLGDIANGIKIDNTGKILVVGYSHNGSNNDLVVWRLNTNGSLDTTFNSSGIFTHNSAAGGNSTDAGNNIVVDNSGKIFAIESSSNSSANLDMAIVKIK